VVRARISDQEGRCRPRWRTACDPAKIDPRFTYAVWARIEEDGKLRFVSDRRHAVSSRGAPTQVGRVLKAVGAAALR